jgi:hypothetical protein
VPLISLWFYDVYVKDRQAVNWLKEQQAGRQIGRLGRCSQADILKAGR